MTDNIQDPFEDFPKVEQVTVFKRGEWDDEFYYSKDDIDEWRSKYEAEIKHNAEIVERVKNRKQWIIDEINRNEWGMVYNDTLSTELRVVKTLLGDV